MKKLILLSILALLISCSRKSVPQQLPPVVSNTTVHDKLTPFVIPPDSSYIQLLLSCDSLNQVYLREITETKGKRVETSFSLKDNKIEYKAKFIHDTIYVPGKDSIVISEIPVPVPTPVYINVLKWWQRVLMWLGVVAVIYIIYRVASFIIKLRNGGN